MTKRLIKNTDYPQITLMNKEQLIADAARRSGMTQREIRNGLNALIESLVEAFENDIDVAIAGLGTFQVRKRSNVKKYLPEDGKGPIKGIKGSRAMCIVPDRRFIKFNPAPYINREYREDHSLRLIKVDNKKN